MDGLSFHMVFSMFSIFSELEDVSASLLKDTML
jgi:hypothetical protein